MIRLLVCGGRTFGNRELLFSVLDNFLIGADGGIEVVIEGEAKGADSMAREWAEVNGIPVDAYPAEWSRYRAGAGPIRNQQMLDQGRPNYGVAFYGGPRAESKGTADMVQRLEKAGIEVMKVGP